MAETKGTKLISLTAETKSFTANGKTYHVESAISAERFKKYQMMSPKLAFGTSPQELFSGFKQIYDICNQEGRRIADIAVIARDNMMGIKTILDRNEEPVVLSLCALFINEESEDRRTITDDQIKQKIADWNEEGIDMASFFQFASATIPGLKNLYELSSRITSPGQ